jgi:hypothetical protein
MPYSFSSKRNAETGEDGGKRRKRGRGMGPRARRLQVPRLNSPTSSVSGSPTSRAPVCTSLSAHRRAPLAPFDIVARASTEAPQITWRPHHVSDTSRHLQLRCAVWNDGCTRQRADTQMWG